MKTLDKEITLKPISVADWEKICADKAMRNLIGVPVFYFIGEGAFYVWPNPSSAYEYHSLIDREISAANILNQGTNIEYVK